MEQSLQLAFPHIDPADAHDERILDLLSAAEAYRPSDTIRALYFANEALMIAESRNRSDLELRALQLIIAAMTDSNRPIDATPFILRAIDLAESIPDGDLRSRLLGALGAWAIDVEQEQPSDRIGTRPSTDWALATIARLARDETESRDPHSSVRANRSGPEIDDDATGLLNARGLAAELLSLEERQIGYAVIRIVLAEQDADLLNPAAQCAAQLVGDRGILARNGPCTLTALLPLFTGIAAMAMAEHLRRAFEKLAPAKDACIAIGVAIRQPDESSRDVLRRVADRIDEAGYHPGINVAG